ncbi:hypothetical protein S83_012067, partial [Arachis hypogaea]
EQLEQVTLNSLANSIGQLTQLVQSIVQHLKNNVSPPLKCLRSLVLNLILLLSKVVRQVIYCCYALLRRQKQICLLLKKEKKLTCSKYCSWIRATY